MVDRVFGVDFSGAADAQRLIWIAECEPSANGLRLVSCMPASERLGAKSRDEAYADLRQLVAGQRGALFGFDFPFSLPVELVKAATSEGTEGVSGTWHAFAAGLARRFSEPPEFSAAMHSLTGGKEPKRAADREAGTPFGATNRRLVSQTYYGIGAVLGPLARDGAACVPPFDKPEPGWATVIEICPASTLKKALGIRSVGYKGRGEDCREKREMIFGRLVRECYVEPDAAEVAERVIADRGGDGLDAVIAAVAAWSAYRLGDLDVEARSDEERLEGRVYYRLS